MHLDAEFLGADPLERLLKRLPYDLQSKAIASGLRAGGKLVAQEAASAAPVRATGGARLLKDGEIHAPGYLSRHLGVRKLGRRSSGGKLVYKVGPRRSAYYGGFIETGAAHVGKSPYLVPALERRGPDVVEAIRKAVIHRLDRLAKAGKMTWLR